MRNGHEEEEEEEEEEENLTAAHVVEEPLRARALFLKNSVKQAPGAVEVEASAVSGGKREGRK